MPPSEREIEVLGWFEAIRRRPEMYVGGRGHSALLWLLGALLETPLHPSLVTVTLDGTAITIDAESVAPSVTAREPTGASFLVDVATRISAPLDQPPTLAGVEDLWIEDGRAEFIMTTQAPTALAIANALGESLTLTSRQPPTATSFSFVRGSVVDGPTTTPTNGPPGMSILFAPDDQIFRWSFRFEAVAEVVRDFSCRRGVDVRVKNRESGATYARSAG